MQTSMQKERIPPNERGRVLKPLLLASIMSFNPSHHLFPHFPNVIGNISKHLAAKMIGTVSSLRGKSGEYWWSNFVLENCYKALLGLLISSPQTILHTQRR